MWTYNDYIYHSGIKGMHWGERRYQNRDGSLTPAGRKRYGSKSGSADGSESLSDRLFNKTIKRGKDKEPLSPAEKISSDASNVFSNASQAYKNMSNYKNNKKVKKGIDSLSNKELQELITRMDLERQYKSLTSERIKEGKDNVNAVLSTVGNLVAVGSSIVGIATTIKKLKGES